MVISAILVALLATMGQWVVFRSGDKMSGVSADHRSADRYFYGRPDDRYAGGSQHSVNLSWMDFRRGNHAEQYDRSGDLRHGDDDSFRRKPDHGGDICHSVQYVRTLTEPGLYDRKLFLDPQG